MFEARRGDVQNDDDGGERADNCSDAVADVDDIADRDDVIHFGHATIFDAFDCTDATRFSQPLRNLG